MVNKNAGDLASHLAGLEARNIRLRLFKFVWVRLILLILKFLQQRGRNEKAFPHRQMARISKTQ